MANGHGGSRPPAHPAAVSGPGAHSQRTDGGPAQVISAAPDQAYGDMKAQQDAQRVAPMAGATPMPPAAPTGAPQGAPADGAQMPQYTGGPFTGPSTRPGEPVTHGAPIGPGAGTEALNLPAVPQPSAGTGQMTQMLQRLSATDTTGIIGQLMQAAQARNA